MSKSDSLFRGKAFLRYHFPNRHSEAKPKNLKSEILRGVYTERSECAQDDGANLDSYEHKYNINIHYVKLFYRMYIIYIKWFIRRLSR